MEKEGLRPVDENCWETDLRDYFCRKSGSLLNERMAVMGESPYGEEWVGLLGPTLVPQSSHFFKSPLLATKIKPIVVSEGTIPTLSSSGNKH